jgi:hypothetical protein
MALFLPLWGALLDFGVVFLQVGDPRYPLLRVAWLLVPLLWSGRASPQIEGKGLCPGHRAGHTEACEQHLVSEGSLL